jgi:hypothetical protein
MADNDGLVLVRKTDLADLAIEFWPVGVADAPAAPVIIADTTKVQRGEDQSNNPWHPSFVGNRTAAISNFISAFGTAKSSAMAKSAGTDIAGRPLAVAANLRRA